MIGQVPHCGIVRGVRNRPIYPRANRLISRLVMTALCLAALLWSATSAARTLVLVSIDGFRWDYLDWPEARHMKAIAEQGTRVTKLRTVYPSKTFPGHLSLATGLHPTGHGIVDNYFCRDDRPDCYSMGSGRKDPSWLDGTPLWTLVEQQGGRASTFFGPSPTRLSTARSRRITALTMVGYLIRRGSGRLSNGCPCLIRSGQIW